MHGSRNQPKEPHMSKSIKKLPGMGMSPVASDSRTTAQKKLQRKNGVARDFSLRLPGTRSAPWLTLDEAAEYAGVPKLTLQYAHLVQGLKGIIDDDGVWLVRHLEIDLWKERRRGVEAASRR